MNHKLTSTSHGGAEAFLERFQQAILDLDSLGQPYNPKMAKINWLNNVMDNEYSIVVETLRMDNDATYHDVLQAIKSKSITVDASRKRTGNRKVNNTRKDKEKKKPSWFLPVEQ